LAQQTFTSLYRRLTRMKILKKILLLTLLIVINSLFISLLTSFSEPQTQILDSFEKKTEEKNTLAELNFCGEKPPMYMVDVYERFDKELVINKNLHASTELIIKRSYRYFPIIEPILKEYEIPDDFKYLAVIESKLENVTSPAGARGIWQFMPATAKEYGLEVNDFVDERYHLTKSTEAACKYLLAAKKKFGSWTLAAASYNGGMPGIAKQIERQKTKNDYYDLLLNEETSRYVFRILALKEIMQNPEKYGYFIPTNQRYKPIATKTIEVNTTIENLADWTNQQGINYKILKIHNPWLREISLANKLEKTYLIEIPIEGY